MFRVSRHRAGMKKYIANSAGKNTNKKIELLKDMDIHHSSENCGFLFRKHAHVIIQDVPLKSKP